MKTLRTKFIEMQSFLCIWTKKGALPPTGIHERNDWSQKYYKGSWRGTAGQSVDIGANIVLLFAARLLSFYMCKHINPCLKSSSVFHFQD